MNALNTTAAAGVDDQWSQELNAIWAEPDAQFWNGVIGALNSAGSQVSPASVLALFSTISERCSFSGPYSIPWPPDVPQSNGPLSAFSAWAADVYASAAAEAWQQQKNLNQPSAAQLIQFCLARGGALRRDAFADIITVAYAWTEGLELTSALVPVVDPAPPSGQPRWLSYVDEALSVAQTLAFSIPEYGPLAAGAIQTLSDIIQHLFPNAQTSPDFTTLVEGLEQFFDETIVQNAAAGIKADAGWLQLLYQVLDNNKDLPANGIADWLKVNVQGPLTEKLNADTGTLSNLQILMNYEDFPGVVELIGFGISTFVALCRQQVVCDLTFASLDQSSADFGACTTGLASMVLDFTRFQQAVLGDADGSDNSPDANWAAQFNAVLHRATACRLLQIQVPQFDLANPPLAMVCTFADKGAPGSGDHSAGYHESLEGWAEGAYQNDASDYVWNQWVPYVVSVAQQLDTAYSNHFANLNAWCTSVAQWAQSLPTVQPTWPPVVESSPDSWGGATPNGTVWVDGTMVRYAAAYANENGASTVGPWSEPLQVSGRSCPTLQLQPDPRQSATVYWVFRQVQPNGAAAYDKMVPIGAPNASTATSTYQDTNTSST